MSDIKTWSTSAASNNAASPNGFPEGMAPSGVNDSAREAMAALRRWYETAQWVDLGDTPSYASATTFTLSGDKTGTYAAGRRLKLTDASTLYGTISASVYVNPTTTVTVTLDSGSLSASLSAVALGILTPTNVSIPTVPVANGGTGSTTAASARTNLGVYSNTAAMTAAVNEAKGADIASASKTDIGAATGNYVEVTGTTTITALGTVQAGTRRIVRFTGALQLTHNATSLILPTGANVSTAANDVAEFISLGSGNWLCTRYMRADGRPLVGKPFNATFTSSDQTISAGGQLIVAHGLGVAPFAVALELVCQIGELGYSAGDVVPVWTQGSADGGSSSGNFGASVKTDATNVTIRFGATAGVLDIIRADTGGTGTLTVANWKLRVKAWV